MKINLNHKVNIDLRFFLLGIFLLPISLMAQTWEGDGSLEKVEVEIVKERQVSVPPASRNYQKIPPRPFEPIVPAIVYNFKNFGFETPDYKPLIRPLKLKQEEIEKLRGNYISAGYGNFSAPYLEAFFNSKRNKNRFFSSHVFHQSYGKGPIDDKNSASGNTQVDLVAKGFTKTLVSGAYLGYENRTSYFYGYENVPTLGRENFKQAYNIYSVSGDVGNSNRSDFNFGLKGRFSYLEDHYKAVESEVDFLFNSYYNISDQNRLHLIADYIVIARKDELVDAKPRHLFKFKPAFLFNPIEDLSLTVGVNTAIENDTISKKSFHLYPNIRGEYSIGQSISLFANVTGDVDKVGLHTITGENLWTAPNVSIFHTNRSLDFSVGLMGKIGRMGSFNFGGAFANLKNWYFYENQPTDQSKFILNYDGGNTGRANLFAEVGYEKVSFMKFRLRGDYYSYKADTIAVISHRPTYKADALLTFNFYNKLHLDINFIAQGGMKAMDYQLGRVVDLKEALDLNVRADYFVSKQFSLFVRMNNILSTEYPLYIHYPVRGFQAMGGVSWTF